MADNHPGREFIDPRLLALMDKAEKESGIFIKDLKTGDIVEIETRNSVYTLKILDPQKNKVEMISTNSNKPGPEVTYANGSSLTGTGNMVKLGWLAPDYRFSIGNWFTTRVNRIKVNGQELVFPPKINLS